MAKSNAKKTAAPVEKSNEDTSKVDQTAATTPDTETQADTQQVEVSEDMKRTELDAVATEAGLVNVSKYANKGVVVDAINRVRGGEDATDIDAELAPVEDDKGDDADVDVEVIAPYYDLQTDRNRTVGETYKTTKARADELRGRELIK